MVKSVRYGCYVERAVGSHQTMSVRQLRASAVCAITALAAACGGGAQSVHSATTRPETSISLPQIVRAGRLAFKLPLSWAVSHGICQCAWGMPDTATLDNGPRDGGVACSCPEESSDAPSGLHLYEGESGLGSGGKPTVINGLQANVSLNTSNATMIATFPGINQWVAISPGPPSTDVATRQHQVAVERQILATFTAISTESQ